MQPSLVLAKQLNITSCISSGYLACLVSKTLTPAVSLNSKFHASAALSTKLKHPRTASAPTRWPLKNEKVYPPQAPGEERRPAYVCHMKTNIKYSPWKMWYIACLVRGMSVDEAVKQLSFILKKGAVAVKETILEAQEIAVRDHNVEFKSNLWVAESLVGKGHVVKGIRRHAKARIGKVEYFHCHYLVRLEEGPPPEHYYYHSRERTGPELLEAWLQNMRERQINSSL